MLSKIINFVSLFEKKKFDEHVACVFFFGTRTYHWFHRIITMCMCHPGEERTQALCFPSYCLLEIKDKWHATKKWGKKFSFEIRDYWIYTHMLACLHIKQIIKHWTLWVPPCKQREKKLCLANKNINRFLFLFRFLHDHDHDQYMFAQMFVLLIWY